MYIVYRLKFNDGTEYIGQTINLNSRLAQHQNYWKKEHNLTIEDVQLIKHLKTKHEALAVEGYFIDNYKGKLRNKVKGIDGELVNVEAVKKEMEQLAKDQEPIDPDDLFELIERIDDEQDKLTILNKKIRQLENRYIKTFLEYKTMKRNIKDMDDIIEEAILRSFK